MKKFGFIFHPLDIGLYADGFSEPDIKKKRPALVQGVMTWFPPFKRATVSGIRSETGAEVVGDMILVSLLPGQILTLNSSFVLDKIIEAGKISQDLGDSIVGLGAYAAQIGHKGAIIAKELNIPVTTGSSYTIAVAIEATLEACKTLDIKIPGSQVCVIGATGSIGNICSKMFASYRPKKLVLVARNLARLKSLEESIKQNWPDVEVAIELNIYKAVKDADIIITSTSTPSALLDVEVLKKGTVICDVSRPRNVSEEALRLRDDILVIDGGIVQPPGEVDFHFSFGLPPGLAFACMAETMILTLEERFESFSLGGNISLERVEEIRRLAKKHGFKLARMRSFDREVSSSQFEKVNFYRKR